MLVAGETLFHEIDNKKYKLIIKITDLREISTDAFWATHVINARNFNHKQTNINVKIRRFGIIMTPFSRQNE